MLTELSSELVLVALELHGIPFPESPEALLAHLPALEQVDTPVCSSQHHLQFFIQSHRLSSKELLVEGWHGVIVEVYQSTGGLFQTACFGEDLSCTDADLVLMRPHSLSLLLGLQLNE